MLILRHISLYSKKVHHIPEAGKMASGRGMEAMCPENCGDLCSLRKECGDKVPWAGGTSVSFLALYVVPGPMGHVINVC